MHQIGLSMGLLNTIHADKRGPQLWHLNKEGLFSLPGYWALALISVGLTPYLHPNTYKTKQDQPATRLSPRYTVTAHLHVEGNAFDIDSRKYCCLNSRRPRTVVYVCVVFLLQLVYDPAAGFLNIMAEHQSSSAAS